MCPRGALAKERARRLWEHLSAAEQRELELEENLQRKDLTAYERMRTLTDLTAVAGDVDTETFVRIPHEPIKNAEKLGSLRRVSERIGVPVKTIHDANEHVDIAEACLATTSITPMDRIAGRWGSVTARLCRAKTHLLIKLLTPVGGSGSVSR